MSVRIPVIKFLFREEFKVLNEALNLSPADTVEESPNANELSTYLSTESAGLVVSSLRDKNDLIQLATFVKLVKKIAKDTAVKIVVINFSGDRNFDKAIAKLGIQDVIELGINTKALKFKLDFWMKSLNAQVKNNPNANAAKTVKSLEQSKAQDKKAADSQAPLWQEPLDLEDDIWILKNDSDCKKVLSKWLIRMLGPSPYVGQWAEVKPGQWRFDIKESEKEFYCSGKGSWFFTGDQKPEFIWKENTWMVSGDNFDLFYKDGNEVFSRFKTKDKTLEIAKNSIFAKTKEPVIIESFNKELVFKREAEKLEDLEGKNKTEQINNGPLSGKNKPADKIGGNLSGEMEGEAAIKQENLVQKTSTSHENKYWGGKNSVNAPDDGNFDGPKSDNPKAGEDLSRDRKDNTHNKHYKNHNEAEKYEAGNLSGKLSTDEEPEKPKEDYSGKSSTDKLRNLGSKDREKAESEAKEEKDLGGKTSTDKLQSHYGGPKDKAQSPEERERERKDKEEKLFKERLQNSEKNKADQAERERKRADEAAQAKTDIEKAREEKKQAETRKAEVEARTEAKTKTPLNRGWEDDHDYSMNGLSETEKLSAHYKSKKQDTPEGQKGAVLPFGKKEEKKPPTEEEKLLEEITRDAKVISTLVQNGHTVDCNLDDYFDETIIFSTNAQNIQTSTKISLDLMFKFEKDTKLKMEGDVVTVEGDGEGNQFVTVQVSKESALALGSFMELYEARQQNVNEFLKRVKGL